LRRIDRLCHHASLLSRKLQPQCRGRLSGDCKRLLCGTLHFLLPGGGHPHMRRREFIPPLGGAAASSRRCRWVGLLHPGSQAYLVAAFREGLKEKRYVEGQNVTIEYRWANGHYDQLQTLAADWSGDGCRKQRRQPFRLSLMSARIPSGWASSPATIDRAVLSHASCRWSQHRDW
jgi:hypothetical protein